MLAKPLSLLISFAVYLTAVPNFIMTASAEERTYTVTANLYCPGELNTQLPGVTAYLTNGNNPLGLEGYDTVAPTTPVENNAQLKVNSNGDIVLDVEIKNPVFTLQSISGSGNAEILSAEKDDKTYSAGANSIKGRIKKLEVKLLDHSGKYVFNNCTEYPTLLGNEWTVPLTLEVDFSGVDFDFPKPDNSSSNDNSKADNTTNKKDNDNNSCDINSKSNGNGGNKNNNASSSKNNSSADSKANNNASTDSSRYDNNTNNNISSNADKPKPSVNYDSLKAAISTAEKLLDETKISADGKDIEKKTQWATQENADKLKAVLDSAKSALNSDDQSSVDDMTSQLTAACDDFSKSKKTGTKTDNSEKLDKTLKSGKYTVSANIWFNKEETGLPLNPHITNSSFPPMDSVEKNAQLVIDDKGNAKVTIPVVIQNRVMTVHNIEGLKISDIKRGEDGAISEITVDLGKLSGESTVVTKDCKCEIQMGDLAMTISGLDKDHTWAAVFELNLSGVATTDGGTMPTVEIEKTDQSAANKALALAGVSSQADESSQTVTSEAEDISSNTESDESSSSDNDPVAGTVAAAAVFVIIVAGAGAYAINKRRVH